MSNYFKYYLMEKIVDFIKELPWDFIVPLIIVVVCVVYFIVAFSKENKRVNKQRKDVQQKIVNKEFAKRIADKYKGKGNDVIE